MDQHTEAMCQEAARTLVQSLTQVRATLKMGPLVEYLASHPGDRAEFMQEFSQLSADVTNVIQAWRELDAARFEAERALEAEQAGRRLTAAERDAKLRADIARQEGQPLPPMDDPLSLIELNRQIRVDEIPEPEQRVPVALAGGDSLIGAEQVGQILGAMGNGPAEDIPAEERLRGVGGEEIIAAGIAIQAGSAGNEIRG